MPIYEYKCVKCKEVFEMIQKISDKPLTRCSGCGGELRKMITNTSFVLKGDGWYVTDYPSEERKKAMDNKKSTKKKEAKPDKKSGSKKEEASTK